ncbi:mannose-6-phosphate isomerase, class I [Streptosporangiaceae bacterium NEAU-GS5]|nr:mannose-6-phosphate isomerase, class I [Streptosporangiaceae bacterium NEAU-GS5]
MDLLTNPIKDYDWGSRTHIAGLTGRAAAGPEAEMWLGAHPSGPSILVRDGLAQPLHDVVAADPRGELGEAVVGRFGPRLPYLLKLIAVDRPLSLQVHPTAEQAADGHGRGDANYSDPWPKPEMICALTPFTALAGFREPAQAAMLIGRLCVEPLAPIVERLTDGDILGALEALLATPIPVEKIAWAASSVHHPDYELVVRLARLFPEDPAVLAPLLLRRHELRRGEALFLGAGVLHCYVSGFGVEIMGSSDNVLRAGLTSKPIDVPELLRVTDGAAQPLPVVPVDGVYAPPTPEFLLRRLTNGGTLASAAPRVAVCTEGSVTVGHELKLLAGESVYLPASDGPTEISTGGTLFVAEPQI